MKRQWSIKRENRKKMFVWDSPPEGAIKNIKNKTFHRIHFNAITFGKVCFEKCSFYGCNFYKCNFRSTYITNCCVDNTLITECNLDGAKINLSVFNCCELSLNDMRKIEIMKTSFHSCGITACKLDGANIFDSTLSNTSIERTQIATANLDEVLLTKTRGIHYASVTVPWHGERGRTLLAVPSGDGTTYFCGCFRGTEAELRAYIKNNSKGLRKSRTLILNAVKMLIEKGAHL